MITDINKLQQDIRAIGYSTFQLWDFIETFGAYIGMGRPNIIEPLEIVYEQEAHHADD